MQYYSRFSKSSNDINTLTTFNSSKYPYDDAIISLSLINVDHDLSSPASNLVSSYDNIEDANEDAICQLDGIDDQATSIYPSIFSCAVNTAGNVRRA